MRPSRILLCFALALCCRWTTVESKPFGNLLKSSYINFDFGFKKAANTALVPTASSVFDILWKKFKVVQTVLSVAGVVATLSKFASSFSQTTEAPETDVSYSIDDYSTSTASSLFPNVFTTSTKEASSKPITISLPTYSADLDPIEGLLPVNKPNSSSGYPSASSFSILPSVSGEITDQSFLDSVQLQQDKSTSGGYTNDFKGYTYTPGQRGSRGYY